ncbi:cytochrome P450 [Teredinibacter turnerae]|uniref:cytochrome P450 n=1 Tax=Teredinibacter turnerae TaxID=2426 RepID=UPI00035CA62D|nr:cytochrome P450 [Teredinibacter turnerae]
MSNDFLLPANIKFKTFSIGFRNDPFNTYKTLLSDAPIFYVKGLHGKEWVVAKYEYVSSALKDRSLVKPDVVNEIAGREKYNKDEKKYIYLKSMTKNWLFFMEDSRHEKIRKIMATWFTPSKVSEVTKFLLKSIEDNLSTLKTAQSFDVLGDLSTKVTLTTISHLLDCTRLDNQETEKYALDLFKIVNPPVPINEYDSLEKAAQYFTISLREDLEREHSKQGFVQYLLKKKECTEITEDEIIGALSLVMCVGLDTTKHLIGNSLQALYSDGKQLEAVRSDTSLLNQSILECGRYNAPVSMLPRVAIQDTYIGDAKIAAGERVYFLVSAACRDGERFSEPDSLNIHRRKKSTLIFGAGHHFCLGAHLSLVIAEQVIKRLITSPDLVIHFTDVNWVSSPGIRGLERVQASWVS